jgi:hypothetical protein
MGWDESSAWLSGSSSGKLYQSLLEDAPEYDPKVMLTAELVKDYIERAAKKAA